MMGYLPILALIACCVLNVKTIRQDRSRVKKNCRYENTLQELLAQQRLMYHGLSEQLQNVSDEMKSLKAQLFPPPPTPEPLPHNDSWSDCADVFLSGKNQSGVYKVSIAKLTVPVAVYCNMENGGGWTVFQRRKTKLPHFNRPWKDYKEGFGDLNGTHWLGNDILAAMTSQKPGGYKLRVEADGFVTWRRYSTEMTYFRILDESHNYKVEIDGPIYDGEEGFSQNNGMNFTTKDRHNDGYWKNCAIENGGGWWFNKQCGYTNLNGPYADRREASNNMQWYPFDEFNSLYNTIMQIRPMNWLN